MATGMILRQDCAIFMCRGDARLQRGCLSIAALFFFFASLILISPPVLAADEVYRGVKIKPLAGRYLVLKDVNVRAGPKTKSKQVGRLKAGEWVDAFGQPKDAAWIAVKQDGKKIGFVFAPVLVPIIDGELKKPISGKIRAQKNIKCDFKIKFIGKSKVEGEVFKISDYESHFKCRKKDATFKFFLPMFITEGPYQVSKKPHYQISIDILQVDIDDFDQRLSTILIYQHDKKRVVFDAITVKEFGKKPAVQSKQAKTVAGALKKSVEIAAGAWGPKIWQALQNGDNSKKKK
jgi:hypothetical protein